jgi:hypothetical protein
MFKILFSVGVLSIPAVFSYVGALPGTLLVVGFGAFNTYAAFLLGAFRLRHPGMHVSVVINLSFASAPVLFGVRVRIC